MVLERISPEGLVLRRDVVRCGYHDRHLTQMVKAGHLVRIRQGAYALASTWKSSTRVVGTCCWRRP